MSRRARNILISVVVLVAVLVVLDRVAVAVAQNTAADQLVQNADFSKKPKVSVNGFPFLTQVISGRYDDVRVSGGSLDVGDIRGAKIDARLKGVHLSLSDVVGNKVKEVRIDSANGTVVLPYSEVARVIGVAGLTLANSNGSVKATAGTELPVVGRVSVSATADVVVSTTTIRLAVRSVSAVGLSVSASVLDPFVKSIEVPVNIPALPYGLRVASVRAAADGIVASVSAQDVVVPTD